MKRIVILIIFLLVLCSCSVQEKMSTEIFTERFSEASEMFDFEDCEKIYGENSNIVIINDKYGTEYVFEFFTDENNNINKISFACTQTDKAENFVVCLREIIDTYSPDENADDVIMSLTENGKIRNKFTYYETQWYSYASYSDMNGMCFFVKNKKFIVPSTVEFSLKPNDKSGF
ncbi:MAG: hypothetical protein IKK63_10250 [Clostridia bacterium]|nr:hypothetical protein [Clostridia bacterium]MBR3818704.1 hypothetical protein [Clostridia bacterium]